MRIEDDMLVTETGVEWMTGKLPRSIADIESFMAKASKEMPWTARSLRGGTLVESAVAGMYR